jgi:hypothetical protein
LKQYRKLARGATLLIEFEIFYMALDLEMTGSGSKRVDRLCEGIEGNGCQKVFATLFMTNTDEVVICATLCYALPGYQTQTG